MSPEGTVELLRQELKRAQENIERKNADLEAVHQDRLKERSRAERAENAFRLLNEGTAAAQIQLTHRAKELETKLAQACDALHAAARSLETLANWKPFEGDEVNIRGYAWSRARVARESMHSVQTEMHPGYAALSVGEKIEHLAAGRKPSEAPAPSAGIDLDRYHPSDVLANLGHKPAPSAEPPCPECGGLDRTCPHAAPAPVPREEPPPWKRWPDEKTWTDLREELAKVRADLEKVKRDYEAAINTEQPAFKVLRERAEKAEASAANLEERLEVETEKLSAKLAISNQRVKKAEEELESERMKAVDEEISQSRWEKHAHELFFNDLWLTLLGVTEITAQVPLKPSDLDKIGERLSIVKRLMDHKATVLGKLYVALCGWLGKMPMGQEVDDLIQEMNVKLGLKK